MRALFYPIMAENKGFILTNNRLSHQSGIRKASVGKTLDLIPFLLFWSEKKKKKKKKKKNLTAIAHLRQRYHHRFHHR
jgi:hypothetical protein